MTPAIENSSLPHDYEIYNTICMFFCPLTLSAGSIGTINLLVNLYQQTSREQTGQFIKVEYKDSNIFQMTRGHDHGNLVLRVYMKIVTELSEHGLAAATCHELGHIFGEVPLFREQFLPISTSALHKEFVQSLPTLPQKIFLGAMLGGFSIHDATNPNTDRPNCASRALSDQPVQNGLNYAPYGGCELTGANISGGTVTLTKREISEQWLYQHLRKNK